MAKPHLIVVLGPTAAGKTDYAIELAQEKNGAVVSADSRQVYKGMDIGTAKVKDIQGIPHHLIDIREPNEPLTLAEWQAMAFEAIDEIVVQDKQPLLVGGTMLYIDSVVYNYDIPAVAPNPALRAELERKEPDELYQELLAKDPEAQQFIEPGNARRIVRALEVIEATGKPFSQARKRREPRYDVTMIGLQVDWDELRRRIEVRARNMFAEGLLEEIEKLREKYGKDLPLLRTQNYRQAGAVLDDTMSQEQAVHDMVQSDMHYAHRQMSWWKRNKEIEWRTS